MRVGMQMPLYMGASALLDLVARVPLVTPPRGHVAWLQHHNTKRKPLR